MVELWQIHATLLVTGFILILLVSIIPRFFRSKPWWFKVHRLVAAPALIVVFIGFITAVYMVSIFGGAHFTLPHHWNGLVVLILAILTVLMGYLRPRLTISQRSFRWIHIGLGLITTILMILNIVLGFTLI